MWPYRVSNPGPLTYESGALKTALCGPARTSLNKLRLHAGGIRPCTHMKTDTHIACKNRHIRVSDMRGYEDNPKIIFLFLNKNICCDPSLELSRRDGSNDGSQDMF